MAKSKIQKKEYDWNKTVDHLETLPDIKDKIIYLLGEKTRYEQEGLFDFPPTYGDKCKLEIQKWKAILEFQTTTKKRQYSNTQFAMALHLKDITITHEGVGT